MEEKKSSVGYLVEMELIRSIKSDIFEIKSYSIVAVMKTKESAEDLCEKFTREHKPFNYRVRPIIFEW